MSNYAIVETGSKQYRVEPNTILEIEKLDLPKDQKEIFLERILLVRDGQEIHVGTPLVAGAKVVCDNLGEFAGPKLIAFKFRRRKASRTKWGHRQKLLRLRVKEIISGK
ncbi:MAG: 50S ribosomal protein L21 [Candidatus Omnitrophica bacterium]|nr:50S ribosomal protein L21 [Candidatus Omnitrophota bacterium]